MEYLYSKNLVYDSPNVMPLPLFSLRGLYPTSTVYSLGATVQLGIQASPLLGLCMWPKLGQSHFLSLSLSLSLSLVE